MDTKVKRKWIKALLSGKYKQGKGQLRSQKDKYCCLGVLLDVLEPTGWEEDGRESAWSMHGDYLMPSYVTCEAIGVPAETLHKLTEMNDDEGRKFKTIAKWIDKNL